MFSRLGAGCTFLMDSSVLSLDYILTRKCDFLGNGTCFPWSIGLSGKMTSQEMSLFGICDILKNATFLEISKNDQNDTLVKILANKQYDMKQCRRRYERTFTSCFI